MNKKDLKRLMELFSKGATINAVEAAELGVLQAKANEPEEMTSEDVSKTVEAAVSKAIAATAGKSLDEAQVKTIVGDAVKGIKGVDEAALVAKVVAGVKPGLTADEVKGIVTEAIKAIPAPSKMQHDAEEANKSLEIEFPISSKSGNLSVAQKQLLNIMQKKQQDQDIPESVLKLAEARGVRAEKSLINGLSRKAITAGGAGAGAEFVNTGLSSVLLARLYMESKLAAAMIAREIQMPTNPFNLPLTTTRATFYSGVAENAAPTGSNPGSAKTTLNASKLMGMVQYSDEADEDSLIAILPMVTDSLGQAAADALEDSLINGDTAGAQDTGGAAGDALRMFDGIRKLVLAQTALKVDLATGGLSAANIGALRKALGKWGMKPADLLLIVGTNGYNDAVLLPETLTAEKAGNPGTARILTGEAPNIFGIDIVPSARCREDLNASGVYDGATVTKGSVLLVHKPSWIQGVRRGFSLETYRDPRYGTNYVVASFRRAFMPLEALTGTKAGVIGYNYAA